MELEKLVLLKKESMENRGVGSNPVAFTLVQITDKMSTVTKLMTKLWILQQDGTTRLYHV